MGLTSLPTNLSPTTPQASPSHAGLHNLLHKLANQVYNVTDPEYGAAGDGMTNDRAAIQAALDDAFNHGGGTVFLPKGVYRVASFLSVNDNVLLVGQGREQTVIKAATGLTTAVVVGLQAQTVTDFALRYLTIDGSASDLTGNVSGVQVTDGARIAIEWVRIKNCRDRGILLNNCPDSVVSNCEIEDVGQGGVNGHGIEVVGTSDTVRVTDNHVLPHTNQGMGIRCQAPHSLIRGNYIDQADTGLECIGVTPEATATIVHGNHALNGHDNGISVSAPDCTVVGNYAIGAQFHGIQINGDNVTVQANVCKNNNQAGGATRAGIHLNNVEGAVVTGNRCYDDQNAPTQDYGVKGSTAEGPCLVTTNDLRGNKTAPTGELHANVVVINNLGDDLP